MFALGKVDVFLACCQARGPEVGPCRESTDMQWESQLKRTFRDQLQLGTFLRRFGRRDLHRFGRIFLKDISHGA